MTVKRYLNRLKHAVLVTIGCKIKISFIKYNIVMVWYLKKSVSSRELKSYNSLCFDTLHFNHSISKSSQKLERQHLLLIELNQTKIILNVFSFTNILVVNMYTIRHKKFQNDTNNFKNDPVTMNMSFSYKYYYVSGCWH